MQIKKLLFTSAALVATAGSARAADAVVMVEPEPVEYVRVCDVYGAGFFYIPGTETCLQIGGYVRMDLIYAGEAEFGGVDLVRNGEFGLDDEDEGDDDNDYDFSTSVRARINIDAREETELGTLRAFVRIEATNDGAISSDASYGMDQGYIQLGGLLMGYTESLWASDVGGATGYGLLTDDGLAYGYQQRNQISYTFAANGFNATVSLEDDDTGDWAPDAVGKLAYTGAFGAVYGLVSYDENSRDSFTAFGDNDRFEDADDGDEGAFAVKAGVILTDLFVANSGLKIEGTYSFDPSRYSPSVELAAGTVSVVTLPEGGLPLEWTIGAAYSQRFGAFAATLAGQYGETFEVFGNEGTEADYFAVQADLQYNFTANFFTLLELTYRDVEFEEELFLLADEADADDEIDQFTGFLRFQRNF